MKQKVTVRVEHSPVLNVLQKAIAVNVVNEVSCMDRNRKFDF